MEEEEESLGPNGPGIRVSQFDYLVENHFKAMNTIAKLCGEPESDSLDESEIQCLYSSITFLREWRYYNYEPRTVRFAGEMKNFQERSFLHEINLPQFSSSTVPKKKRLDGGTTIPESSKDFVMYVGGSVWALDWCPRAHEKPNFHIKCEYVAVAAHPPDSYYHKLGTLLTGRGVVQIWCILNVSDENEEVAPPVKKPKRGMQYNNFSGDKSTLIKKPRGRPRKQLIQESPNGEATKEKSTEFKRPRGRPRKQQIEESLNGEATKEKVTELKRLRGRSRKLQLEESPNGETTRENREQQIEESPNDEATKEKSIQFKRPRRQETETSCNDEATEDKLTQLKRSKRQPRKKAINKSLDSLECNNQYVEALAVQCPEDSSQSPAIEVVFKNTQEITSESRQLETEARANDKCAGVLFPPLVTQNKDDESFNMNHQIHKYCIQDPVLNCGLDIASSNINSNSFSIPKDVALPRVVLCLAHNGKVVWDVKWRPCHASDSKCHHRMGYLAVLLGNGSLEVWDVPLPHAVKIIYSSSHNEDTDPRFVKLKPVFRCSFAKCGEMQSIPLTVEWSTSYPHDYLLVGCHDGTVALWKFSASGTSEDTRPLLCFSADTYAIRAVAWAPFESDHESSNVILTAGHGGLKFWDIRDPFRPLWEHHPLKSIYSLDWLPDPRSIILSSDDGTMTLLSLVKFASDGHVNGKPPQESKQPGLHNIYCSTSFAIWNVQVSRKTGMVAYCGADGSVCHFQLTKKAVEKDASRHRAPHFMAGSLSKDDESAITVNTPLQDASLTLKKPVKNAKDNQQCMQSLFDSDQTKTANSNKAEKAPVADNQVSACLCDGEDPGRQSGFNETLAALKSRIKPKSKKTGNKIDGEDKASICIDERQDGVQERESEKGKAANKFEVLPPDIVAMHRVRWNMNKGSERWLCSGGAAGILRCQEIK
ncbi:general transcription factor 3C polypeptide 2 isoform X2 [Jatropha curcas]|uniref:general transcription factor 3C polypeptide 2 isoform X2 n=1 Tax=Jatropha curcas TaxID=180498 RepID=UPI0018933744|nr:general transcription factor 3C polypeptide 2 isoform X2 [Jatropha curcas]